MEKIERNLLVWQLVMVVLILVVFCYSYDYYFNKMDKITEFVIPATLISSFVAFAVLFIASFTLNRAFIVATFFAFVTPTTIFALFIAFEVAVFSISLINFIAVAGVVRFIVFVVSIIAGFIVAFIAFIVVALVIAMCAAIVLSVTPLAVIDIDSYFNLSITRTKKIIYYTTEIVFICGIMIAKVFLF